MRILLVLDKTSKTNTKPVTDVMIQAILDERGNRQGYIADGIIIPIGSTLAQTTEAWTTKKNLEEARKAAEKVAAERQQIEERPRHHRYRSSLFSFGRGW
jgi:hypothetical protein